MISVPATDYGLLERLGMNHSQIKSAEVSQVLTEILRCIRKKNCQKTNRCTPLRLDTSVKSVVNSLFCAAHMTELSVLWEAVLDLLACCTTEDKDVLEIYQMLTDTQCSAYITDTRVLLTPKACLSLWSSYLPSLEIEVLRMIDATTSCLMLPCCVKKLINSRHLPYCCAVRPQIFHTVLHMLHTMLAKSAGNGKVTEVITQFCQCVWEQSMSLSDSQQMLYPLCRVYSASLQPLINLFSVQPADLSCDAAAHHVKQITQFLHGIHDNSTTGTDSMLQLCLLHHRPWYSKAVLVCLQCSRKFIEPCVELMMWFHWTQDQNKLAQLKKHTNSVISLHPLLLKGTLKETDIQYAVTATEKFESDHIIVGHILMAFLFLSVNGMHVAQFILKLVTDSDSPCQHLLTLLMSQQQLMIDLSSLSTHTLGNYKELLVDLRSKVKPVDCSGEVKTLSFEQYQTLLNVVSDTLNDVQQILSPSGSRELDISQWR